MSKPKEDVRIQRTYDQLLHALTDLLAEKPFEEIRVTDICELSGIHRSTFYAHFEDKHHLLTYAIQELMDIFLATPLPGTDEEVFRHALHRAFKYFLKNKREYTLLFLDPRNASAKQLFHHEYIRSYRRILKKKYPQAAPEDITLFSHAFVGSFLSVVDWWLETDTSLPLDQITDRFCRLIPGHLAVFGPYVPPNE